MEMYFYLHILNVCSRRCRTQDGGPKAAGPTELVVKLVENPVAIRISSSRYILTLQETNKQLDLKLSVSNDQ